MTAPELLAYVEECKKRNLTPEVWAGKTRFDIMDVTDGGAQMLMVVVSQAFFLYPLRS